MNIDVPPLPDGWRVRQHHVDGVNPYTYRSLRYNRGGRGLVGVQLMTGSRPGVRLWWQGRSIDIRWVL